jgi:hypothetical protein
MVINVTDSQIVGETLSTLFSMIQTGPVNALIILKNSGVNTMNYDFQEYNGTAWVDLGASGSPLNNTLQANQVVMLQVQSNFPQVQLVGNASGGAFLEFAVTRYVNRSSGGPIPILNL